MMMNTANFITDKVPASFHRNSDAKENLVGGPLFFEHPFSNDPDYRYLYLSKELKTILNTAFEYISDESIGIMVIEGENGLGKSMLARRLDYLISLKRPHNPLYIRMTGSLHKIGFWKLIAKHFNLPVMEKPVSNCNNLTQFLEKNHHRVMFDLIIDNAEEMNSEAIEVIQELDSLRYSSVSFVQSNAES
jgi:type II secretory pathway predicted ATPase ExeA